VSRVAHRATSSMRALAGGAVGLTIVLVLVSCGGSSGTPPSTNSTSATSAPGPSTSSTPVASAAYLGCGQYCAQAGVGQADVPPGYPCSGAAKQSEQLCLRCPADHCMSLLTTRAQVRDGQFKVELTCNLSVPCHGALLVCVPTELCGAGAQVPTGYGGRVAGSDFRLPAKGHGAFVIAVTSLGQRLIAKPDGYRGDVLLDLENYGDITLPVPPAEPPRAEMYAASLQLMT
jgi:hypothetical protein